MKKNKKIVFVAGMHGNEKIPIEFFQEEGIDFILANEKAYQENKRIIDADLNASFGVDVDIYESKRAKEILNEIPEGNLVLDFHTTTADTPPFAIIVDKKMVPFAKTIGLDKVVFMKHNIKNGHALLNYRNGVSIEMSGHTNQANKKIIASVVENIKKDDEHLIKLYEVFGVISKPGDYKNFVEHEEGFVPVMAGENSYDFYGLKAREVKGVD